MRGCSDRVRGGNRRRGVRDVCAAIAPVLVRGREKGRRQEGRYVRSDRCGANAGADMQEPVLPMSCNRGGHAYMTKPGVVIERK